MSKGEFQIYAKIETLDITSSLLEANLEKHPPFIYFF
jgi:hypothetical protein